MGFLEQNYHTKPPRSISGFCAKQKVLFKLLLAGIFFNYSQPNLILNNISCGQHYSIITKSKIRTAAAAAKSLQSCPTVCDPIDGSPPGSPVPGILQARTLEWAAISFSNAWKWKVKVKSLSRVPCPTLTRLLCPCEFSGKSTGVGCHCLLQNKD